MIGLDNINKLAELKKSMTEQKDITRIQININTKDYKEIKENETVNNKLNNIGDKKNIHSNNFNDEVTIKRMNYNELKNIKRGDVFYVDLEKIGFGSEQFGIRYSICIQNDIGNKFSPTIIVAFITSQLTKSKLPTHVDISGGSFGLPKDSVVLAEQIRTLDKRRIIKKVGKVDELTMRKIDKALGISIGELEEKTNFERLPKWIREAITRKIANIHSFERAWLNSKTNNQSFKAMCLKERELCLNDLEEFCLDNKLNYKDYYTQYSESECSAM